ncbi:PepSY domain-containing protein [Ramlibacter pallidus]|uniref:PepSY domain-containing protein n=1 Tax=Ramlibacter pallidus TaxID=2780087 RepID=A0ABR9S8X8_9BURK|nr:PepSY domain-containing protein [Ramlibacter pallidus]MBE7369975.1 PepSY domain-containing protein [Ramlibacter pallidus]
MRKTLFTASCIAFALSAGSPAWAADKDETLPVTQLVAAIQAAVAAHPGNVKEVEVKKQKDRMLVEVEIYAADGKKQEVKVDAQTSQVVR